MRGIKQTVLLTAVLLTTLCACLLLFGLPIGTSLANLWTGAVGDKFGVARSLVRSVPLILCGLGIAIAWRARMYNIGGEGQYVVGGITGALAAKWAVAFPTLLGQTAILLAAVIGGCLWASISAWLHVKRGVQVVISTILLNFLALQLLEYVVQGPLQEPTRRLPQTERLPTSMMLAGWDRQTDLHSGVLLALIFAAGATVFLFYTWPGFRLRFVGANSRAATVARMDVSKTQSLALMLSGGFCGLAGGVDYLGLIGQVGPGFSQNWGFFAIPVALLGGLHPLGVIGSGIAFGALFAGSENLARYNTVGGTVVLIVQAVAMLAYLAFQSWSTSRMARGRAA